VTAVTIAIVFIVVELDLFSSSDMLLDCIFNGLESPLMLSQSLLVLLAACLMTYVVIASFDRLLSSICLFVLVTLINLLGLNMGMECICVFRVLENIPPS
jgi:hypothetical protein